MAERPEPDCLFDDSENRLDSLLPLPVSRPPLFSGHPMSHFPAEAGFFSRRGRIILFLQVGHAMDLLENTPLIGLFG